MGRGNYGEQPPMPQQPVVNPAFAALYPPPAPPPATSGIGWKGLLVLSAVAVGIYAISPGVRAWIRTGSLPAAPEDDGREELERVAREKGFASAEAYEQAVAKLAAGLRVSGHTVFVPTDPHLEIRHVEEKKTA